MSPNGLVASCSCGAVALETVGKPIIGVACYCDDCQSAAKYLESLPGAPTYRQGDGGTPFIVYRKDRVRWTRGEQHVIAWKLRNGSSTNRCVAQCCNSVMILNFEDAKHWVDVFRARTVGNAPEPQARICTKFATSTLTDSGPPRYSGYPPGLLARLLWARIAMVFS